MQNKNVKSIISVVAGAVFALLAVFTVVNFIIRIVSGYSINFWNVITFIFQLMALMAAAAMMCIKMNERLKTIADLGFTIAMVILAIFSFIIFIRHIGLFAEEAKYLFTRYSVFKFFFVRFIWLVSAFLEFLAMLFMAAIGFMSFRNISNIIRRLWFVPAVLLFGAMMLDLFGYIIMGDLLFYLSHYLLSFFISILMCVGFACAGYSLSGDDAPKLGR